jgi:hypothetical protein
LIPSQFHLSHDDEVECLIRGESLLIRQALSVQVNEYDKEQ